MFIYRNKRTGVEISTLCPVGGEWELIEDDSAEKEQKPKETKKPAKKKK